MKKLLSAIILSATAFAGAQWTQFHGNAQHNGYIPVPGPSGFNLLWETDLNGPVVGSPIVAPDGTIYVGPIREDLEKNPSEAIYALNQDGSVKWRFDTPFVELFMTNRPSAAVGPNGVVYFGSPTGTFYAINPDGKIRWQFEGVEPIIQSPAVAPDGTVYISIDGILRAFTTDGVKKWEVPVGDHRLAGVPAIAADGTIYATKGIQDVGSWLLAINPNGTTKWEFELDINFWPLGAPVVGQDGTIYVADLFLRAINPDGTQKWMAQPAYPMQSFGSPAVDPQGNVYHGTDYNIFKINNTGQVVWTYRITEDQSRLGHTYNSPIVDSQGNLYTGLGNGRRWAIDIEKKLLKLNPGGTVETTFTMPEIAYTSSFAYHNGRMFIGSTDGKLRAFGTSATAELTTVLVDPAIRDEVISGTTVKGAVYLSAPAPAGGMTVTLTDDTTAISTPTTVTIPAGATKATFDVNTSVVSSKVVRVLRATTSGKSAWTTVTLTPGLKSLTVTPNAVPSNGTAQGVVALLGAASSDGAKIRLTTNSSALTVPADVVIPAGGTAANFTVKAGAVTASAARTVTATYGTLSKTAVVNIEVGGKLAGLSLANSTLQGGGSSTGTVTISGPAPTAGAVVTLTDNTSAIATPASVTVLAGATTSTFSFTTTKVSGTYTRSITATYGGVSKTVNVTLTP